VKLRSRPTLLTIPIALALTLALAAAASAQVATLVDPDESPPPENESAGTVPVFDDREEALLAFAQCMRDNGIDMDDPQVGGLGQRGFFGGGPGGNGGDIDPRSEEFRTAQQACDVYLEASRPEIDPEMQQELLEQQLLLAQCIRENGYPEYPDPTVDADGRFQRAGRMPFDELGIDFRSEAFQEVMTTCRDQNGLEGGPGFGGGFGPGPGAGGD
jgi:hypothetical protein